MCTAIAWRPDALYFGRTLDYDVSYGHEVVVTPRRFPFALRHAPPLRSHFAMLGMACVRDGYPLYYDAMNERGLCIAGLNFVGNAAYSTVTPGRDNVAQFELIPWLLGTCADLAQARAAISRLALVGTPFADTLPLAQLHWLIADSTGAITLEAGADGVRVYDNPVGVLTNNPPFPMQMQNLNKYQHLTPKAPENRFAPELPLAADSLGMGALGLPGDLSSQSRFVRAAFTRCNAVPGATREENISQFFHILGTVEQVRGCCEVGEGNYEITFYTSCCDAARGIYYYTTYENRQITAVSLHSAPLDGDALIRFLPLHTEQIRRQN